MINLVVALIIIFFVFTGLRKGFCRYLLEFLVTAISLALSWFYYLQSQEILRSLLVFICLFFGLSLLKWFFLRARQKKASPAAFFSLANRFWGAILGLLWGIFIASMLIFAAGNISYLSKIRFDEQAIIRLGEQPEFQELLQHESFKAIMEDEELRRQLQNRDLLHLLANPKIANLLNDGSFLEKLMQLDFQKAAEGKTN